MTELISQGANPNHADQLGSTPLHWAAQGGHERIIPVLINAGDSLKGLHCCLAAFDVLRCPDKGIPFQPRM